MTRIDDLKVEIERYPLGTVVHVIGDAVLNCITLELALMRLNAERPTRVVLDLSRCGMISSLAIGLIVGFNRGINLYKGQLRLAAPSVQVLSSLKFSGLTGVLAIFDNTTDALA